MNDQEAIVLLKSDSHEAFEYLYKVYGGQVYNFSKLYINSSEDIKEVVQEVFVKLWEARSFLREDENFRGFLFIVTRNLIFNRQKKTFNENFYKLSVLSAYEQSNIDSYNIEEELQAKELNNYIDKIIEELDRTVRLPGLANLWVPPIRNRIDMLSTGIKSPIGIKVSGTVLSDIDVTAQSIEAVAKTVPGVVSALAERLEGGRYIDVDINREKASRYGMTVGDVQLFVSSAIGGAMVGETVEGVARYPINIRYPQDYRNSPQALREMPILTPMKQQITLGDVADIKVVSGPTMLKTENARPASWIYVDARGRDMVSVVNDIKTAISEKVKLRPGTSVAFSGQFELLEHANKKLKLMVPMTVMIIFILLYLAFRRVDEALLILMSLPFALVGGIWFLYWQGFHMSVATGTGFIALAGVAAEFGVVMLMYLRHAIEAHPELSRKETFTPEGLDEALYHGAVLRVRPKAMTVAVIIAGLLPILWGTGAGSEVMSRIAAPMIGGMITAPLLSLFIIPAAYKLIWLRKHKKSVS